MGITAKPSGLQPYSRMRKYRMLCEWVWKSFWPTCTKCSRPIEFEPVVAGDALLPFVDVESRRFEHATCNSLEVSTLRGQCLASRLVAYQVTLGKLFAFYDVKCWYCLVLLRESQLSGKLVNLTLHHVDEDRGDERLRGKNPHAELELLHESCHKRHHMAETTKKATLDRVNGARCGTPRFWRYEK